MTRLSNLLLCNTRGPNKSTDYFHLVCLNYSLKLVYIQFIKVYPLEMCKYVYKYTLYVYFILKPIKKKEYNCIIG